eukprot:gene12762-biopygen7911
MINVMIKCLRNRQLPAHPGTPQAADGPVHVHPEGLEHRQVHPSPCCLPNPPLPTLTDPPIQHDSSAVFCGDGPGPGTTASGTCACRRPPPGDAQGAPLAAPARMIPQAYGLAHQSPPYAPNLPGPTGCTQMRQADLIHRDVLEAVSSATVE